MYRCIQSVAQFCRLRSNKAEENCFTLDSSYNHVFLTGNPLCILGDPGADSGGEGKSKRAEKYGTKEK